MGTKKWNWLLGLLGLLVLINLGILAMIWLERKEDKPREAPEPRRDGRMIMVNNLGLDSQQARRFDTLRLQHFTLMQEYREEMRGLKDAFFERLRTPEGEPVDSLAAQIGRQQAKMDLFTFQHFAAVRAMLREDQLDRFDRLIHRMARPPEGRRF